MAKMRKKKIRTMIASRSSGKALSTELTMVLSPSILVMALSGLSTRKALKEESDSCSSSYMPDVVFTVVS